MNSLIRVLAAFAGAFGFALSFNARGKKLFWASLSGFLDWGVYIISAAWSPSEVFQYFWAALFLGLYAEIVARRIKTPTTIILVVGFIPLIPGSALYYMVNHLFLKNAEKFVHYGIIALSTAVAISCGIIVSMFVTKLVLGVREQLARR